MSETVISIKGLSKRYRLGMLHKNTYSIRDGLTSLIKKKSKQKKDETIWALKDVSFDVNEGEILGIIGPNGAGKSTLLKILSRITKPDAGEAFIDGRVGSLLEVGTGFHPELTGRENIYLNGAILGMKKAEIKGKFDEIVAFAEIEKFVSTPVKRYSSGMYVRLAFAVAAHLQPEILLVDEVLAVGDASFQKKCLSKMNGVANEGRTVLFVSHNMHAITDLCPRTIWLNNGRIYRQGTSELVVSEYLSFGSSISGQWHRPKSIPDSKELELLEARIKQINLRDGGGVVVINKPFNIEIKYKVKSRLKGSSIVVQLLNSTGTVVFTSWDTDSDKHLINELEPQLYRSICKIPAHLLKPGNYSLTIAAHIYRKRVLDLQKNIFTFMVSDVGYKFNLERKGLINPVLDWVVEKV